MAVSMPPWLFQQLFDNDGLILAGGKIYAYASLTTTPLATFTDATETVASPNPIVLDAAGRCEFWLAENVAYTFVLKDVDGVTIKTIDDIIVNALSATAPPAAADIYLLNADESPPTANQWLFGAEFRRPITFAANFVNSGLALNVPPAAVFVATCRKNSTGYFNGTAVGTLTIQTNGTYAFTTTAGAEITVGIGDWLDWYGPSVADVAAMGFRLTMVGFITGSAPGDFVTTSALDAAVAAAIAIALPPGVIDHWGGAAAPTGWLECNGAAISRVTYSGLYSNIGTSWGVGNGTTTFNLPDLRGKFWRGWDHSRGIDTGRTQFSNQDQATLVPNHKHPNGMADDIQTLFVYGSTTQDMPGAATYTVRQDNDVLARTYQGWSGAATATDATPATETRPVNVAGMFIIKF